MSGRDPTAMQDLVIPDEDTSAAVGTLVIVHGHLNHILVRTVKTLLDLDVKENDLRMAKAPMGLVFDRVRKHAIEVLGDSSPACIELNTWLSECERVTDARNWIVHGLWTRRADGTALLIRGDEWRRIPSAAEVASIAAEIVSLLRLINGSRLRGSIADELKSRKLSLP